MRLTILVASAALAGSAIGCSSVPANPTWTEDVKPILQANCIKCHGRVTRGGAPDNFRLDIYDGTDDPSRNGFIPLGRGGASDMAQFIAFRVREETMPPEIPLTSNQIEVLENWFNARPDAMPPARPERGEPDPDNEGPEIVVGRFSSAGDTGLDILITDPDFDIVHGTLTATPVGGGDQILISDDLHSGRAELIWESSAVPEGAYELEAVLRDEHSGRQADLGLFDVVHANGNQRETIALASPIGDDILSDDRNPLPVQFAIDDPDDGDTFDVTISLERGQGDAAERFELAAVSGLAAGEHSIDVDTSAVPAGPNYTLRVATAATSATAERVVVGHGTTSLRFADVGPILNTFCRECHPGTDDLVELSGLRFGFFINSGDYASSFSLRVDLASSGRDRNNRLRGTIYRRVVLERTMPPKSGRGIFDGETSISQAQRDMLGEWLLAGAPCGLFEEGDPEDVTDDVNPQCRLDSVPDP